MGILLSLFSFLTGPLGKIVSWVLVVTLAISMFFGYIKLKEHQAAEQALMQYNATQQAQIIADAKKYQDQIDQLQILNNSLQKNLDADNKKIEDNNKAIETWLSTQVDKNLDPIFNETLKRMRGK